MSKKDKENYKILEQERNLLKITLDYYAKENDELKRSINDMKMTVKANKDQLNEYVSTITNKDMVVEKMTNTIIQLKNRLEIIEEKQKLSQSQKFNNQPITHNDKTEKVSDNTRENTTGNKNRINSVNLKGNSNPTHTNNQAKPDEIIGNAGVEAENFQIEKVEDMKEIMNRKNLKNMKNTFEVSSKIKYKYFK